MLPSKPFNDFNDAHHDRLMKIIFRYSSKIASCFYSCKCNTADMKYEVLEENIVFISHSVTLWFRKVCKHFSSVKEYLRHFLCAV